MYSKWIQTITGPLIKRIDALTGRLEAAEARLITVEEELRAMRQAAEPPPAPKGRAVRRKRTDHLRVVEMEPDPDRS